VSAGPSRVVHEDRPNARTAGPIGRALPHERPEVLRALLAEWLARVERPS